VPAGATVSGYPARPHKEALRAQAGLFRLPELMKRLRALERAVLGKDRRTHEHRTADDRRRSRHSRAPACTRVKPRGCGSCRRRRNRRPLPAVDLEGAPEVPATLDSVAATDRNTTLAVSAMPASRRWSTCWRRSMRVRLDNLVIEIDGPEVPIADGSFAPFFELLRGAGTRRRTVPARVLELRERCARRAPAARRTSRARRRLPRCGDHRVRPSAHPPSVRCVHVTPDEFACEIAPARTFGFLRDAEALRARGLVKGVSFDNAIILDERRVASGELRWPDEFVRHKAGDVIGDLALLGSAAAQVIATRPSHAGNIELAQAMVQEPRRSAQGVPIVDITRSCSICRTATRCCWWTGSSTSSRAADRRHQERHDQRAVLPGSLPGPPHHAGGAAHRGDGAGRRPADDGCHRERRGQGRLLHDHGQREVAASGDAGRPGPSSSSRCCSSGGTRAG
jgi:UDP-3-O-acyl-N-acetylglucosamine deacetylase